MATELDTIFDVIERHRELSAQHAAAASVSSKLVAGPEFDAADAISEERGLALEEYADVLIHSKPTTLAGVIALSRYVVPRGEQDGSGASTMMRGLRRARDAGRA
ncbi:hypothetical protein [Bradyrhizobium sp. CCBAU 21365]|uniref:hypothetical protein n=1 Tax=Bradyrhizobium sp. CCBAU 21365 TaxID=1325083 RepID=UPI001FEEC162|nr:hypothetical protein [Bradyrhizobium sp. CCBAU 21365]